MSAISPAMQAAVARRETAAPQRPRRLVYRGVEYLAHDPGDWLSVDQEHGHVYLKTPHVDVILNGVEFVKYEHDGAGGLTLTGNHGAVQMSLEMAKGRFEHIEAWRDRMADYPLKLAEIDKTMASLLNALDQAERHLSTPSEQQEGVHSQSLPSPASRSPRQHDDGEE